MGLEPSQAPTQVAAIILIRSSSFLTNGLIVTAPHRGRRRPFLARGDAPSLSELVIACGKPLQLSCDEAGHWQARKTVFDELVADGETAEEALGRLWLLLENETS